MARKTVVQILADGGPVAQAEPEAHGQPVLVPDPKQISPTPLLPDVFGKDMKPGSIPLFNSLEIFQNYLMIMASQKRAEQA